MNKRRLEALCRKLDTLPRKRFDYNQWVGADWKGAKDLSCGTTACALGWATTIPSLRRAGLILVRRSDSMQSCVWLNGEDLSVYNPMRASAVAAARVFGISENEAQYLFVPRSEWVSGDRRPAGSAGPKTVAKHIRRFIARGGPSPDWQQTHA